jgi:hypothetical protein
VKRKSEGSKIHFAAASYYMSCATHLTVLFVSGCRREVEMSGFDRLFRTNVLSWGICAESVPSRCPEPTDAPYAIGKPFEFQVGELFHCRD